MALTRALRDYEIVFSLVCDGCGRRYPAGPEVEGDPVDLWLAAFRDGWRLAKGLPIEFLHHCPVCSPPPAPTPSGGPL